jgi:hypothetical protein
MGFPAAFNILYYRGDTYEFVVQPKNADGTAFDLTDYPSASAKFTIASRSGSTDTFVFNGDVVVNNANSYITCTISNTDGATLVQGTTYVYDVEIKSTDSINTYTLIAGGLTVTNDISGRIT